MTPTLEHPAVEAIRSDEQGAGPGRIGRLPPSQVAAAKETLGLAFRDDPLLQIAMPDRERRHAISSWFMGLTVAYGLRWGEVWANQDASAVAVWAPPNSGKPGLLRMLQVGVARLPLEAGIGGVGRIFKALAASEKLHETVHGPHWYLLSLGTRPERQGQGFGGRLVEVGTSRADEAGLPCYLETATQSNIDYYSKRGFEVTGQVPVGSFTVTGMVRPPRSSAGATRGQAGV